MSCAVLLKRTDSTKQRVADFLSNERGLSREDAAAAYQNNPGFLLENASLAKASAFNIRASAFGLETVLIDSASIKTVPPATPAVKMTLTPSGLHYFTKNSIHDHIPFEEIRLVSLLASDVEITPKDTTLLEAGLLETLRIRYFPFRLPIAKKEEEPEAPAPVPKEIVFLPDIVTAGGLRLNWSYDDFDYSGLGVKKTYSSLDNLRILLEEITASSFKAAKNELLTAFLKRAELRQLKHPSQQAYEKELQWLLTVL